MLSHHKELLGKFVMMAFVIIVSSGAFLFFLLQKNIRFVNSGNGFVAVSGVVLLFLIVIVLRFFHGGIKYYVLQTARINEIRNCFQERITKLEFYLSLSEQELKSKLLKDGIFCFYLLNIKLTDIDVSDAIRSIEDTLKKDRDYLGTLREKPKKPKGYDFFVKLLRVEKREGHDNEQIIV